MRIVNQRADLRFKLLRRDHFVVRHVLGQVMIHEDGHARADRRVGQGRGLQDVRKVAYGRVGGHIGPEIVRHPQIRPPGDPCAHHLAHVVAEVRAVIEIPRLAADAAGRKVPVRRDGGQRLIELRDVLCLIVLQVLGVDRPGDHHEVDPGGLTPGLDRGDALHARVGVGKGERLMGIVGEDRIAL